MTSLNDKISQLVNEHCWQTASRCTTGTLGSTVPQIQSQQSLKVDHAFMLDSTLDSLDFGLDCDGLLADFPDFLTGSDLDCTAAGKRKPHLSHLDSLPGVADGKKRLKLEEPDCVDFDTFCYNSQQGVYDSHVWPTFSGSAAESCDSGSVPDVPRRDYRESSVDSLASENTCPAPVEIQSAEYHFEQIRKHCQLATECLQRSQYEKTKNIVTWAHDIKNKFANEVKKAAEKAWEADKDKEDAHSIKHLPRKPVIGSTKRVEQFRKNLRRWMTGTHVHQVGVEWMVFARMEHLQNIANFILGDCLPNDPASPTAVAESISKFLGQSVSQEFVEQELAEPEPGKRYTIGTGLVPYLHAKQPRTNPSLAFTMPSESDPLALQSWLSDLKALFPSKPAPKVKGAKVQAFQVQR